MWVNDQKKFVFVSTPKSGTHTMYNILRTQGGKQYGQPPGVEPQSNFHRNVLDPSWEDYYKFTVVRNPFSRAVAAWWHLIVKKDDGNIIKRRAFQASMNKAMGGDSFQHFTAFLLFRHDVPDRAIMFDSQHEWHNNIQFDKVIKLEQLQQGLNEIPLLQNVIANKKQKSFAMERQKPITEYYTREDVDNVVKGWNDDFVQFDYPTTLDI